MSKIIGIDLGTTFSAIAQLDDLGNPEVLASTDTNKKITASAVYLKEKNAVVGDKALDALIATAKNVVTETKRQMENDVMFSTQKGEWIDKEGAEEGCYSPAQVSSFILSKLKGYTSDVKKAVKALKEGQIEIRNDKDGNIGASIWKKSFSDKKIIENFNTLVQTILKEKPTGIKGDFILSAFITSTMGISYKLKVKA